MSNQVNSLKKGLTVKDLVTTGIFSAIFFVFTLVGGLPFAPNPVLTFYMPMGAALLCGPIYLLMVAKVQKRWSVTILGIIMGIIWFATGMHWAFSLGYIGMGLIADLVAGAGHYRNKAINLLSYMLISLGGIYTYVVFFLDPDGWASTMLKNGTEQSYIDTMNASAPSWLLISRSIIDIKALGSPSAAALAASFTPPCWFKIDCSRTLKCWRISIRACRSVVCPVTVMAGLPSL